MNGVAQTLARFFPGADVQQLALVLVVGVAIFLLVLGVGLMANYALSPARRRLQEQSSGSPTKVEAARWTVLGSFARRRSSFVMPTSEKELGETQRKLAHAGFQSATAMPAYYTIKLVSAVALTLVGLLLTVTLGSQWSGALSICVVLGCAFLGVRAPNMYVDYLAKRYRRDMQVAFPDALDLLVVCVEAGLGLMPALQRVAEELQFSHPRLSEALSTVTAEVRAGVDREQALRNLVARTGMDDIRGLVSLINQTLRFGTSIGDTLRVYSADFRDRRMQRAEETAAKVGTKLIFPLILCLFPAFFIIALGPAFLRLIAAFAASSAP